MKGVTRARIPAIRKYRNGFINAFSPKLLVKIFLKIKKQASNNLFQTKKQRLHLFFFKLYYPPIRYTKIAMINQRVKALNM